MLFTSDPQCKGITIWMSMAFLGRWVLGMYNLGSTYPTPLRVGCKDIQEAMLVHDSSRDAEAEHKFCESCRQHAFTTHGQVRTSFLSPDFT